MKSRGTSIFRGYHQCLVALGLFATGLVALVPEPGSAQTTITGRVLNDGGDAFPNALVRVGATNRWRLTDRDGRFTVTLVPAGEHRLTLSHPGTQPRGFSLRVPSDQPLIELGTLQLSEGDAGVRRLQGTVTEAAGGNPLNAVVVRVFNQSALTTDSSGAYVLDIAPLDGDPAVPITFARLGYVRKDTTLLVDVELSTTLDFQLQPSPLTLAGIVVEEIGGAATSPRIRGFFDRRRLGFGDFFTAEQIERMGAQAITDVVRRIPGISILTPDNVTATVDDPGLQADMMGRVLMSFNRGGTGPCAPVVFIDDARVQPRNIDQILPPERIAAMEVYKSANAVPVNYRGPGSECGALVLWTKQLTAEDSSPFEIGLGFGGFNDRLQVSQDWTGGYMAIPVHPRIDLYPAFQFFRGRGDGYRLRLAARYRLFTSGPLGLHLGSGAYFENRSDGRDLESLLGVLVGIPVRVGPLRMTAEAQWIDPTGARRLDFGLHFGLAIRSGN